jgi:hypothetical protein
VEEVMRMVKDMWVVEKVKGEEEEKVREEEVVVMNNMEVMMNNMEVMVVAVEETKGWLLEEDR